MEIVQPEAKPFEYVRQWDQERERKGWWHSFELPDGSRIDGVCSLESLRHRLAQFPIPQDLRGKRVLDIGTWDGFFAFEMERRGAEVVAIDNWDNPRFHEIQGLLESRVEYRQMDMYELTPESIGRFHIVLFMGVLYHLKHPLLALERVCALTTEMAAVDSFVLREEHRPGEGLAGRCVMEFFETTEFGGQTDNWVGPSLPCLLAFCRTAGFARVELQSMIEHSACVACHRHWETPPLDAPAGPRILAAYHDRNFGQRFDSQRDEYVTAEFESRETSLTLDDLQPEVGGYGVRPINLVRIDSTRMSLNFKLPPGLTRGTHEVRLRLRRSASGGGVAITVE